MVRKIHAKLLFWSCLAALLCTLSVSSLVRGQANSLALQPGQLTREGTEIDSLPAICRFNGERLIVEVEGLERPILALENLAAQRILEAVRDDPNDGHWLLNGTITEFMGSNYVLLKRVKRFSAEKS